MEKVFTVKELMKILKVSEPIIRRLLKDNTIKSIKVGGSYRVTERELNRFLQQGEERNEMV